MSASLGPNGRANWRRLSCCVYLPMRNRARWSIELAPGADS